MRPPPATQEEIAATPSALLEGVAKAGGVKADLKSKRLRHHGATAMQ
jgi:hypothetical protein